MKRVLIVDDHEVVRRGLKQILNDEFSLKIYEAESAQAALDLARRQALDLVLLDINMPGRNGLEILEELKRLQPDTPVLILTISPEEQYALRCFKLGAAGYLNKRSASDELVAAVRKALAGGRYVTPALAEKLAASFAEPAPHAPHELLSNRELQVLRLIAAGRTTKEIGAELSLSEKTIATYRARIGAKMQLGTNVELTRYALQHGLAD